MSQLYPRYEHTAACAAPDKDGAVRVADQPHGPEVGEGAKEKNTRRHGPCRQTTPQNACRARFFGDIVADLDVKASRRPYGAERADPRSRPLQARRGHASANKSRESGSEAVEIRRQKAIRYRLRTNVYLRAIVKQAFSTRHQSLYDLHE